MSNFRTKLLGFAAFATAFAGMSYGQVVTATTPTATTATTGILTLRGEGETELVGDTTTGFTASNGANATITGATVYVTLTGTVTSKLISTTPATTDAALILNGGAPIYGTASGNTLTFTGITLNASAGGTANTVVIQNVRVNASSISNPSVTESVLIQYPNTAGTGSFNTLGSANPVPVGYILPSLSYAVFTAGAGAGIPASTPTTTVLSGASFATCTGGTSIGNSTAANAPTFFVSVKELTAGAFKTQVQENGSFVPGGANANGYGLATQATQISLTFANVPASATIYVPLSVTAGGTTLTLTGSPTTVSSPTTVTSENLVAYPSTAGAVTVTYYASTAAATASTFPVPVWISFAANSATAQTTAITVNVSYAPAATITGPATLIPTFAPSTATPTNLETITNCQTTLLFPFVTNQNGFETGIAVSNTTTDNIPNGTKPNTATPVSGICTLNFYGATTTQPMAFMTPTLGAPTTANPTYVPTYASTLSTMSGATNFQGYAIAVCPFPDAHGFAYIVDGFGTTSGTAEGYLAVVIPRGTTAGSDAVSTGDGH